MGWSICAASPTLTSAPLFKYLGAAVLEVPRVCCDLLEQELAGEPAETGLTDVREQRGPQPGAGSAGWLQGMATGAGFTCLETTANWMGCLGLGCDHYIIASISKLQTGVLGKGFFSMLSLASIQSLSPSHPLNS